MANDLTEAGRTEKARDQRRALLALTLPIMLALTGCMRSGGNVDSALSLDPMTTGSVSPLSAESEIMSDEAVVRELIGALADEDLSEPRPWSNALTGSAGVASDIAVSNAGARSCRVFQTTRHGFDGVALFNGRICRMADGGWDMVTFERAGS